MTRIGMILAWILATAVTTAIAWQVVGAADDQVSDQPLTPLIAATTPAGSNPSTTAGTDTSGGISSLPGVTTAPTTTSTNPTSTTQASPTSTSTAVTDASTTTVPGSSTTTGAPNVASTTAVSDAGTVSVSGTEPSVTLVAIVANPGWSYAVTRNDGQRVEVEFEDLAGNDIRIRVEWDDGRLVADIDD